MCKMDIYPSYRLCPNTHFKDLRKAVGVSV